MNAGKSTALLQVAHNYESLGKQMLLVKPAVDLKGGDRIVSRLGVEKPVDFLWQDGDALPIESKDLAVILVDEAQFLTVRQANDLLDIATAGITVIAYGLRTDFRGDNFPGAARLLSIAHEIEEIRTLCRCGSKATMNLRKIGGVAVFDGSQVAIDDGTVEYESMCASCHRKEREAAGASWD